MSASLANKSNALNLLRAAMQCLVAAVLGMGVLTSTFAGPSCHGKFPNPITDICWSCTLPISIGGTPVMNMGQEDIANPSGALCTCSNPPSVGIKVGFWEPARLSEVTRTPWCMVSLGGVELNPGFQAPRGSRPQGGKAESKTSFYHVHWYLNPIWFYLETLMDNGCLEQNMFDVAYLTEVDPLWSDDELTLILNPDVYLFANPIAQAACAVDCVAATSGFPLKELFWCAGCQGSMYPLNGHVGAHVGGIQASYLLTQRMAAKMHRELLTWAGSDAGGLCGFYPEPLMDKRKYKAQLLYPVPQTGKPDGKCCQPFGRSSVLWGSGKEFPVKGEDFTYQIFRKRNCCASTGL
jgi:conjugal transfer pilus assembly protein TraU